MFRSQLSNKQYGPNISPVKVVTQTRPRTYINTYRTKEGPLKTVVSQGWEIVQELSVGPDEVERLTR